MLDLYDLLLARNLDLPADPNLNDPKPSNVTFTRVYSQKFRKCLRFRPKILQSKCDDCERFKVLRAKAVTPEAADMVGAEHLKHVKSTFLDRSVDERVQRAATDAVTTRGGVTRAISSEYGH